MRPPHAGGAKASGGDAAPALRAHCSAQVKLRDAAACLDASAGECIIACRTGGAGRGHTSVQVPYQRRLAARPRHGDAGHALRGALTKACAARCSVSLAAGLRSSRRCSRRRTRLRRACLAAGWWRSTAGPPSARAAPAPSRSAWRAMRCMRPRRRERHQRPPRPAPATLPARRGAAQRTAAALISATPPQKPPAQAAQPPRSSQHARLGAARGGSAAATAAAAWRGCCKTRREGETQGEARACGRCRAVASITRARAPSRTLRAHAPRVPRPCCCCALQLLALQLTADLWEANT